MSKRAIALCLVLACSVSWSAQKDCRRWFHYLVPRVSLRNFLIGTTVLGGAIGLGYPIWDWRVEKKKQRAGEVYLDQIGNEVNGNAVSNISGEEALKKFRKDFPGLLSYFRGRQDTTPEDVAAMLDVYRRINSDFDKKASRAMGSDERAWLKECLDASKQGTFTTANERAKRDVLDELLKEAMFGVLDELDLKGSTGHQFFVTWALVERDQEIDNLAKRYLAGTLPKGIVEEDLRHEVAGRIVLEQLRNGTASDAARERAQIVLNALRLKSVEEMIKWHDASVEFRGRKPADYYQDFLKRLVAEQTLSREFSDEKLEAMFGPPRK